MSRKGIKYKNYSEFKMARMKNLENKSSAQNKLFKAIAEEPPSKKSCCSDISIVKDPMMMTGNTIG